MHTKKEVSLSVKHYFDMHGMTLTRVAELLGVTLGAVTNQLRGDRYFGRYNAEKYAELFGFSANYLMTGEGQLSNHEHLVIQEPEEGKASAQEKVERLLATIESQQRTIEILARKLG